MKSMTAYAASEKSFDGINLSLELKGYNARYLDIYLNLPSELSSLSPLLKERLTAECVRGKVELNIKTSGQGNTVIKANIPLAKSYYAAMKKTYKSLGSLFSPGMSLVLRQKGVLESQNTALDEKSKDEIMKAFESMLVEFKKGQTIEGEALARDITAMIEKIEQSLAIIKTHSNSMEDIFYKQMKEKVEQFKNQIVDENRILQEIAIMLMKHTINEEIIRLEAHLMALRNEINSTECSGKKIDFIAQEINREINTIGSKNQLIEISQEVIEMKHALENIREQARNVK